MKKINLIVRLGLFALILGLGTLGALLVDETKGLALTDLSGTSVQVVATAYGLRNRLAPGGIFESVDGGYSWTKNVWLAL